MILTKQLPYLALFILAITCFGCETSETLELAGAADQYITIDHGGQPIQLTSPERAFYIYEERPMWTTDYLNISRKSTDGKHRLKLRLDGAKLRQRRYPMAFGRSSTRAGEGVRITYTSYELNDDPVCPHLEGVPTFLDGTIFIDDWAADGIMIGTFITTPDEAYQITGAFRVFVP